MKEYDEFFPCRFCFKDSRTLQACLKGRSRHEKGSVLLRSHSYESMKREARRLGHKGSVLVSHSDWWQDKNLPHEMCLEFCQVPLFNMLSDSDIHETLMERFLLTNQESKLTYPVLDTDELSDMIPEGAPVLDFLRVKAESSTWSIPSSSYIEELAAKRAVNYEAIKDCQIKEIVIGEATDSEIREFSEWIKINHKKDMKKLPVPLISFDCEFLDFSMYFTLNMFGKLGIDTIDSDLDDRLTWPVKMQIGNGYSYAGIVTFHVPETGYAAKPSTIPKAFIEFLEDLPLVTGCGIRNDLVIINKFMKIAYGREVKFRGSVDISVLAVLAGWTLKKTNMFTLAFVGAGVLMNKLSSIEYDKWGKKFKNLDPSMQCYAVCDIKVGWLLAVTFLTTILYNWFPDQKATCSYTKSRPFDFVQKFMQWVVHNAKDTMLNNHEFQVSTDVESAMNSIRRFTYGLKLRKQGPRMVQAFLSVLDVDCHLVRRINYPRLYDPVMEGIILKLNAAGLWNKNPECNYWDSEDVDEDEEGDPKKLPSRTIHKNEPSRLEIFFGLVIFVLFVPCLIYMIWSLFKDICTFDFNGIVATCNREILKISEVLKDVMSDTWKKNKPYLNDVIAACHEKILRLSEGLKDVLPEVIEHLKLNMNEVLAVYNRILSEMAEVPTEK